MDPGGGGGDPVLEAILRAVVAEIDNTRLMAERVRVERVELDVMERQLEMLKGKKAEVVSSEVANQKLVRDFLKFDNTEDFQKQNDLKYAIAAAVNPDVVELIDGFLVGDSYKNLDDPKAMAGALLDLLKSGSFNGVGDNARDNL